ncbi:MAG: hypothetical protein ACREUL_20300 [Steroidobacteraceae bacterium]
MSAAFDSTCTPHHDEAAINNKAISRKIGAASVLNSEPFGVNYAAISERTCSHDRTGVLASTASAGSIVLVEYAITDRVIHIHGTADSLGDLLVFANPVFDSANHLQRGHDQGYCIRVISARAGSASGPCF